MTWKSHTAVTAAITYAITLDPLFAAAASVGAVLPDRIEFMLPWLKHRGNSHALALWILLVAIVAIAYASSTQIGFKNEAWNQMTYYGFAVVIGAIFHLLEDMCSVSGIPLLPTWLHPGQKAPTITVPLYKTGTISEYIVAGILLAISAGIIALRTSPQII
jgi:membrane-bound metal-dependent hydrolase YbcI (DUF457 family)